MKLIFPEEEEMPMPTPLVAKVNEGPLNVNPAVVIVVVAPPPAGVVVAMIFPLASVARKVFVIPVRIVEELKVVVLFTATDPLKTEDEAKVEVFAKVMAPLKVCVAVQVTLEAEVT